MKPENIQIIISNNSILRDVFPGSWLVINESDLENYGKIDLLIVDKALPALAIDKIIKISNKIINFIPELAIEKAAVFLKPFRLHDVLEIIYYHQQNEAMFCLLNNEILYSQKGSYINYDNKQISLTDKESELFLALLRAPNYSLSKEDLLTKVWLYSKVAETSTVDVYLSRLRALLPAGFLNVQEGGASLKVVELK